MRKQQEKNNVFTIVCVIFLVFVFMSFIVMKAAAIKIMFPVIVIAALLYLGYGVYLFSKNQ